MGSFVGHCSVKTLKSWICDKKTVLDALPGIYMILNFIAVLHERVGMDCAHILIEYEIWPKPPYDRKAILPAG
jgi:hypothetical protein